LRRCRRVARMAQARPPRDGKRVGGAVWFDITLGLPVGLSLVDAPSGSGVVVEEVREGGSAATHNARHMLENAAARKQWIQEGDELLMVDGTRCASVDTAVELIGGAANPEGVTFKFARAASGNVKVVFPESTTEITVPRAALLSQVAAAAGHEVEYRCPDGTCGSCWHVDDGTEEVYLLCQEDCVVGRVPSKTLYQEDSFVWNEREYRERKNSTPNYDNSEPLVLRSCPELYEEWKLQEPAQAKIAEARETRFGTE